MYQKERYITVNDDWYPCYEGNKVRLKMSLNFFFNSYYVKLSAWGCDDFGVEKIIYEGPSEKEAKSLYYELEPIYNSIPDGIDKEWFFDRGFVRF